MEIEGVIKLIEETKEYGNNGFQKREMVLTTEENYPQHILVEFVQDKVGLLDGFTNGQKVRIGINIKGREWTSPQGQTKYFNSIQGWRIESLDQSVPGGADIPPSPPMETYEPTDNEAEDDQDDLPF